MKKILAILSLVALMAVPTMAAPNDSAVISATVGQYGVLTAGISGQNTAATAFTAPGTFGNVTLNLNANGTAITSPISQYVPVPMTVSTNAKSFVLSMAATPFNDAASNIKLPNDITADTNGNITNTPANGTHFKVMTASQAGDSVAATSGNLTLANLQADGVLTSSAFLNAANTQGLDVGNAVFQTSGVNLATVDYTKGGTVSSVDTLGAANGFSNVIQLMPQLALQVGQDAMAGAYASNVSVTFTPTYAQ